MKRKALLVLLCLFSYFTVFAQNIKVTGKVSDAVSSETLIGVSVSLKGSTVATQTDVNGNYVINVPANGLLVFTYLGFVTQEIPVNGRESIDVKLSASAQQLEQVVVIGYGTQRKRDLTGSITSVKGGDIEKSPNINPISSLQGKVAGLTIVNSGTPGAAPTVRIRGVNSTGSSNPIYVVDGVIQTNIDYVNQNDIESIEVLKDPSSTAIFGVQGGNGVIVVTTKRAVKGETRVSFQSSAGIQTVPNQIDVVDASGFKRLYAAQLSNLNAAPFDFTNYTANTDWQDLVLKTAAITNSSLSISNSTEKTTTLVSLGYNNQEGVVKNSNFQRYNLRLNQEIRVNSKIRVGADIVGSHYISDPADVSLNNALWAAPIVPVQLDANTYYSMPSFQRAQVGNPIATLNRNDKTSVNKGYRAVGNIFAEVTFLKQFKARSSFYTDLSFNGSRGYNALPFSFINLGEGTNPTETTFDRNVKTSVNQNQAEFRKYQQDHTITYDSTFNKKHKITALAGFSSIYTGSSNLEGSRRDTTLNIPNNPDYWYLNIINNSNPAAAVGGNGSESAQLSYFGRVNYAFNNKYLANASVRRDGISKFAPANRWGTFGSIGLGWVVSEESFFKNVKKIDFLKLRTSWGTLGNANGFGENLYLPGLQISDVGVFGDNVYPSVSPAYFPDPNLRWEVIRGFDIGLEAKAFDYRLSADIALYDRTTKDIITSVILPNQPLPYRTNLGTISNKGIEIALSWNDKIGSDFTYNISPNMSYNKNKVESIGNNFNFELLGNNGANRTRSGESIGYFYGYKQVGIYQSTADLDKMPAFSNSLPGDIAYEDVNGDGVITTADRTNLGSPFPNFNYGINVSFGYKQFDVLLEGQGVAGNLVYTQRRTSNFAVLNYESNRLNAYTTPGSSNIEPILDNSRGNNYFFSNYFLEPGDYFRLRTAQLGYTFGKQPLTALGLKTFRLYMSGQNIKTWSKTTGYTPEAPISNILGAGADNGIYPIPAIYTVGVNVTF
ncbi:SusC/RagA family TonB-linked outer membrane protein [Pedobacter cryophilus]|uniref:TonB-dependent receptor n=1 Tax=Pedobacter cryophilus TaxID=2571271 RepID=A0A4U1C304_9SPHI|nr:TonB-dependent receptor [Pedobacter cryophilus]TKC00150.1 TonB-dependent receptor [Pedobacter cryophilus]